MSEPQVPRQHSGTPQRDGLAAARRTGSSSGSGSTRPLPRPHPPARDGSLCIHPGSPAAACWTRPVHAPIPHPRPVHRARVRLARTLRLVSSRMHFAAGCSLLLAVRAGSSNSSAPTHCAAITSPTHHASSACLPILADGGAMRKVRPSRECSLRRRLEEAARGARRDAQGPVGRAPQRGGGSRGRWCILGRCTRAHTGGCETRQAATCLDRRQCRASRRPLKRPGAVNTS